MTVFDLYGSSDKSMDKLRDDTERTLGIEMESHDSSFWGEYEMFKSPDGERIAILVNNISHLHPDEGEEFHEPD